MAPKTGFAAMLGADAVDEGVVSFEGGIVFDARVERLAFEHVPCGMAIALVFGAVQGVLDHGSPEESGRERMLAFEGFGSRIEALPSLSAVRSSTSRAAYLSSFQ